eukprot:8275668-Pyramimonas_sp.AAC.1
MSGLLGTGGSAYLGHQRFPDALDATPELRFALPGAEPHANTLLWHLQSWIDRNFESNTAVEHLPLDGSETAALRRRR